MSPSATTAPFAWALHADSRRPPDVAHLYRQTTVNRSLDETFAFFSDASNLERLTPPWLRFRILSQPPIVMREGTEIDYRIVLYGIPIPWKTRIEVWDPGVRFADRQVLGPYRWWHHEHRFEAVTGGTRVVDHIEYLPRARWVSGPIVRRDVERIFAYRQERLRQLFGCA